MLPDVSDTLARLSTGQIGQIEPSLCKLEQVRLIGRTGSPASKFHGLTHSPLSSLCTLASVFA